MKRSIKTPRAQSPSTQFEWRCRSTIGVKLSSSLPTESAAMLLMYRGYELVPIKDGEKWQAQLFSGGKRITTTMPFAHEEVAITQAKKIADEIRNSRRSA
jgi:hypothetical protein